MNQLSPFVLYSIKVAIALALLYLPYRLFLARLTFYRSNRYYLLGYSILSLLVPLFNLSPVLPATVNKYGVYVDRITQYRSPVTAAPPQPVQPLTIHPSAMSTSWHAGTLLEYLLLSGMAFMLIRLCVQAVSLLRMKRKATLLQNDDFRDIRLYSIKEPVAPFSFGKSIFVHLPSYEATDLERIVAHETVHVTQHHTFDIMFTQLMMVFQWWNPFMWLMDRSIRQNLEFLADESVMVWGADRKQYQYLLLKVTGARAPQLCNGFNFSPLKTRIAMMNKQRSSRVQAARFLFVLPLLIVLLGAFSRHRASGSAGATHEYMGFVVDSKTFQPLDSASVTDDATGIKTVTDATGYFHLSIPVERDTVTSSIRTETVVAMVNDTTSVLACGIRNQLADTLSGIATLSFIGLRHFPEEFLLYSNGLSPRGLGYFLTKDTSMMRLNYEDFVNEAKTDRKLSTTLNNSDKIYHVIDGKSYAVSEKYGYVWAQGGQDLFLVNNKTYMTGEEINNGYTKDQVGTNPGFLPAEEARKRYGIAKALFVISIIEKH